MSVLAPESLGEGGGLSPTAPRRRERAGFRSAALRSVGLYLLTLFVVVSVVFALPRAMPSDPLTAT